MTSSSAARGLPKARALQRRSSATRILQLGRSFLLHVVLIAVALVMIIPMLWSLSSSLKPYYKVFMLPPEWIPNPVTLENYAKLLSLAPFGRWIFNTAFVTCMVTFFMLLTSAAAGYAFAKLRFPYANALLLGYLATLMLPGHVTLIPRYVMMQRIHWVDTYQALIIPASFGAFGTFFMRQAFVSLPDELRDAALIDGCSYYSIFRRIMLPLVGPNLATLGVFTFVGEWNSFLWPFIISKTAKMWLISVGLWSFAGEFYTDWGLLMAGACVCLLPTLAVYLLGQRYFVRSVAFAGLKG